MFYFRRRYGTPSLSASLTLDMSSSPIPHVSREREREQEWEWEREREREGKDVSACLSPKSNTLVTNPPPQTFCVSLTSVKPLSFHSVDPRQTLLPKLSLSLFFLSLFLSLSFSLPLSLSLSSLSLIRITQLCWPGAQRQICQWMTASGMILLQSLCPLSLRFRV